MILKKKIGYGLGIAKKFRVQSGIGYPSGPDHEYFEDFLIEILYYMIIVDIDLNHIKSIS